MPAPRPDAPAVDARARATSVLAAALLIAVAGDLLLRGGEWRLGFTLLVALVTLSAFAVGARADRERNFLLAGTVVAALGLVLRDAMALRAIDLLSVLCMGALTVWRGNGRSVARLEGLDAPKAAVLAVLTTLVGAPEVLRASSHAGADTAARAARTRALAIGVVIALPPLLIVMALLGSADSVFAGFLSSAAEFLSREAVQHVVVIAALAWLATGWLLGTLDRSAVIRIPEIRSPGLPFASASVGLYGLVVLLTLFLATQLRVLFGGAAYLSATAGLTVAQYAREGFFQLVVVAGIVLATLVAADWLVARDAEAARPYRVAGTVLVGLVAALLLSASARMWLYVSYFGLTIDRVLATAIMLWVLAAFVTFAATMLRGRGDRFAPAILLVTIGWVAALNVANPEGIVVRANLERAAAGKPFDAQYHAYLSADALPALLAAAPTLPAIECADLARNLAKVWKTRRAARDDWRSWSVPYARAIAAGAGRDAPRCAGGS
ncbi:MAG: DUF4173 domain-containing protein [Gemmatimonadetes bacterium]|nr:DUF4173 domain-containing protein [Gemmatimonadota bacterium]